MPKQTFHNLPEDKKEKVLEVAIEEFANYSYHNASISRMVEKAGIAKGSFYQYFENKQDLFKYIIDQSGIKKLDYLSHIMNQLSELSIFQLLHEVYLAGIKFAKDYPLLRKIGDDFIKNADPALKEKILGESVPKRNKFLEGILKQGIQRGEIDPRIDASFIAFILTSLSISISEYYMKELQFKEDDDQEIIRLMDNMLYIIENGIKAKEEK